eukprot:3401331-Rhodomonas_salina.2
MAWHGPSEFGWQPIIQLATQSSGTFNCTTTSQSASAMEPDVRCSAASSLSVVTAACATWRSKCTTVSKTSGTCCTARFVWPCTLNSAVPGCAWL